MTPQTGSYRSQTLPQRHEKSTECPSPSRIHGTNGIFKDPWMVLVFIVNVGKYLPVPWIRHVFFLVSQTIKLLHPGFTLEMSPKKGLFLRGVQQFDFNGRPGGLTYFLCTWGYKWWTYYKLSWTWFHCPHRSCLFFCHTFPLPYYGRRPVYKDSYGGLVHFWYGSDLMSRVYQSTSPWWWFCFVFLSIVYIRSSPATNVTTLHIHTMQGIETSGFLPH